MPPRRQTSNSLNAQYGPAAKSPMQTAATSYRTESKGPPASNRLIASDATYMLPRKKTARAVRRHRASIAETAAALGLSRIRSLWSDREFRRGCYSPPMPIPHVGDGTCTAPFQYSPQNLRSHRPDLRATSLIGRQWILPQPSTSIPHVGELLHQIDCAKLSF